MRSSSEAVPPGTSALRVVTRGTFEPMLNSSLTAGCHHWQAAERAAARWQRRKVLLFLRELRETKRATSYAPGRYHVRAPAPVTRLPAVSGGDGWLSAGRNLAADAIAETFGGTLNDSDGNSSKPTMCAHTSLRSQSTTQLTQARPSRPEVERLSLLPRPASTAAARGLSPAPAAQPTRHGGGTVVSGRIGRDAWRQFVG